MDRLAEIEERSSALVAYYCDVPEVDMRATDDFKWLIKRTRSVTDANARLTRALKRLTAERNTGVNSRALQRHTRR